MTTHRRQRGISRVLVLVVLTVVDALGWQHPRLRQLRCRLAARPHDVAELLAEHPPARQPVSHRRTVRPMEPPARPGLSMQAVVAGRWAEEEGPYLRRLRELVAGLRAWRTRLRGLIAGLRAWRTRLRELLTGLRAWRTRLPELIAGLRERPARLRWQLMQLTAATAVVLPMLLIPELLHGDDADPSTAWSAASVDSLRNDYPGFTRELLDSPQATETRPTGERASVPATDGSGSDVAAPDTGRADSVRAVPASDDTPDVQRARPNPPVQIAPYLFLGGSKIPDARTVMRHTGVTAFTLAFVLSNGGCAPAWGGTGPLAGSVATTISQIQAAGGEVIVSFGGWSGHKLGTHCPTPRALAAVYQRVIDVYRLRAIDVDIEYREFENPRAQDRVLRALKIIEANNPGITTIVTMPVARDGLNSWGRRMVRRAAELGVPVDVWTIMPFVLGQPGGDMGRLTVRAAEHTHRQIARYHPGLSAAEVYRKLGISTMNGDTGAGETVTQADFREIRRYVHRHGLARLTFWAVNRDRSCLARGHRPCSGIPQHDWQFTKIVTDTPGR